MGLQHLRNLLYKPKLRLRQLLGQSFRGLSLLCSAEQGNTTHGPVVGMHYTCKLDNEDIGQICASGRAVARAVVEMAGAVNLLQRLVAVGTHLDDGQRGKQLLWQ